MREILRKIGTFFEQHVEKIVLVVVGLVCVWLLFTRVIFSPNVVKYENKNMSPSAIDAVIQQQAAELEYKINQPASSKRIYGPRLIGPIEPNDPVRVGVRGNLKKGYLGLLSSAIEQIDGNVYLPMPLYATEGIGLKREYRLPTIGEVTDVAAGHIRAVAYLPTGPVTEEMPYDKVGHEANDIDLVTVEAKFDVAGLYQRFNSSFAGEDVREEAWRDPCLARPVFAAVNLQRQELLPDGAWSDWQDVPRSSIDSRKRLFQIIEKTDALPPGGIKVRMLQFNDRQVTMDLLQPIAYQIASAKEDWFPPTLHRKFLDLQKKEDMEVRNEEAEKKKEQDTRNTPGRDQGQGREQRRGILRDRSAAGTTGGAYEGYGTTDLYGTGERRRGGDRSGVGTQDGRVADRDRSRTAPPGGRTRGEPGTELLPLDRRNIKLKPSTADAYDEFDRSVITEMTDLSKLKEPLLFWAHDDTVEPGAKYRYRIRLGLFNPVAGTNQVAKQDEALKNQVILWSDFSRETDAFEILRTLYFFAIDLQEAAKTATMEVWKYALGYWRNENFKVKPGEVIGKVVETEIPQPKRGVREYGDTLTYGPTGSGQAAGPSATLRPFSYSNEMRGPEGGIMKPESIDYRTGAVLLDLVEASDWRGDKTLRRWMYNDALYTLDGTRIEHMPVKSENWPKDLSTIYQEIKSLQREPQEPLRAWNAQSRGRSRSRRQAPVEEAYGPYEGMLGPIEGSRSQRY